MVAFITDVVVSVHIIITNTVFAIANVGSVFLFTIFVIACMKDVIANQIFVSAGVIF